MADFSDLQLDVARVRRDFPILDREVHGKPLVYLDNAATCQTPRQVIEVFDDYYRRYNANIHRGLHTLADEATAAFEGTRETVRAYLAPPRLGRSSSRAGPPRRSTWWPPAGDEPT